jgi:hypothetical protein
LATALFILTILLYTMLARSAFFAYYNAENASTKAETFSALLIYKKALMSP